MSNISVLGAALICIFAFVTSATPIDYSNCTKKRYFWTKDGWLSGAPGEQAGNFSSVNFGYYRTNANHFWLFDFNIAGIAPFDSIAGVQLVLQPENDWRGVAGMYYNSLCSDSDWIQGTQQDFTNPSPAGEPNFLCAQYPDIPWKQGVSDLRALLAPGAAPLTGDSGNYFPPNCIFDLDKNVIRDFLEGRAHGICIWGWDAAANGYDGWYWYRAGNEFSCPTLWVYKVKPSNIENDQKKALTTILSVSPVPFAVNGMIRYRLSRLAAVSLDMCNLSGKHIVSFVKNASCRPGTYSIAWNGTDARGYNVSAGVYFLRLTIDQMQHHHQLVIVR